MQGTVPAHDVKDAFYQRISAKVTQFTQRKASPQVIFAIGVTPRTTQGAFAGDFNGKQRNAAAQNSPPGTGQIAGSKTGTGLDRLHLYLDASRWHLALQT